jgi:BRCT domain type II-containing protein
MTNEQQIIENAPEGWTHVDVVNDKRHVYKERTIDDYRKRSDIERIAGLEKERDDTLVEASKLAMSIYNRCYRDKSDAVSIDLLDSTLGVMTQIDNMVTGVLQERDEFAQCLGSLVEAIENSSGYEPSVSVLNRAIEQANQLRNEVKHDTSK